MEFIYTIREDGEKVHLTVTSKPTHNALKTEKLFSNWAVKTIKKEGYNATLLKHNTHVAKHNKVASTTWTFLKIDEKKTQEPVQKPTRKSSRKTRTKTKKNTITKLEE